MILQHSPRQRPFFDHRPIFFDPVSDRVSFRSFELNHFFPFPEKQKNEESRLRIPARDRCNLPAAAFPRVEINAR